MQDLFHQLSHTLHVGRKFHGRHFQFKRVGQPSKTSVLRTANIACWWKVSWQAFSVQACRTALKNLSASYCKQRSAPGSADMTRSCRSGKSASGCCSCCACLLTALATRLDLDALPFLVGCEPHLIRDDGFSIYSDPTTELGSREWVRIPQYSVWASYVVPLRSIRRMN